MHKDSQWLAADLWGKIYWTSLAVDCIVNLAVGGRQEASSLALGGFLVSSYTRWGPTGQGPGIDDCNRLWTTLVREFITDLEIRVQLPLVPPSSIRPRVTIMSPGLDPETGAERPHVWATTELRASNLAFTYGQLYDLLLVAYRTIEGHLGGQETF
jgi:hypothetical protein